MHGFLGFFDRSRLPALISVLGLSLLLYACQPSLKHYTLSGETMGTRYHITVSATRSPAPALHSDISTRLQDINQQMSTYLPDSEISQFNRQQATDWIPISAEFATVITESLRILQLTGGAFDPTIQPLVELWGFGSAPAQQSIPSQSAIDNALRHSGGALLELNETRLRKLDPLLQIDLSAIAKGYAVDVIARTLEKAGHRDYLVEIGGEVRAGGKRHDGRSWRVAVQQPDDRSNKSNRVIELQQSIATSGDYRNFFEYEGLRYAHVIDPASGRPPANDVASVTVLDKNCMTADALATALMVMGLEKGLAFAKEHNLAVYYILRREQGFETRFSPAFEQLVSHAL